MNIADAIDRAMHSQQLSQVTLLATCYSRSRAPSQLPPSLTAFNRDAAAASIDDAPDAGALQAHAAGGW